MPSLNFARINRVQGNVGVVGIDLNVVSWCNIRLWCRASDKCDSIDVDSISCCIGLFNVEVGGSTDSTTGGKATSELCPSSGNTIWEIDNETGNFRWFTPGVERLKLMGSNGDLDIQTGALLVGGTSVITSGRAIQNVTGYSQTSGTLSASGGTISLNTSGTSNTSIGNGTGSVTLTGSSSSSFVLNGTTVSAAEFNVLDAGIELGDLTTQGTATDEFCLTSETGGGALLAWQSCGGGDLDTVYAADSDKELLINNATGLLFDMTTTGDFIIQDSNTTVATFDDSGGITFAPNGTSDFLINQAAGVQTNIVATAAPTVSLLTVSNSGQATTTNAVHGLDVTFAQGAGAGIANAGLQVSASTTDNDSTLRVARLALTNSSSGGIQNGLLIVNNDDAANATTETLITLLNSETTADSVTDYLTIGTSSTDTTTDAIDVSSAGLFNAINMGNNFLQGDGMRLFASSSTAWTFEDTSGNDLAVITDNGSSGILAISSTGGTTNCSGTATTSCITPGSIELVANGGNVHSTVTQQSNDNLLIQSGLGVTVKGTSNAQRAFEIQNSSSTSVLGVNTLTSGLNLITNPNFESNINGWAAKGSATVSFDTTASNAQFGNATLKIVGTGTTDGAAFSYPLAASQQYSASFWVKVTSASPPSFIIGRQENGSDVETSCSASAPTQNVWTQYTCTFTTGATINGTPNLYIRQTSAGTPTLYIDGVTLVTGSSTLTFINPANNLQIDANYGNITLNNFNTGEIQPWRLNPNSLGTAVRDTGVAVANGYMYVVGGCTATAGGCGTNTNTVYYSKINTDGTLGTFTSTTVLPASFGVHTTVTANGYIYAMGGYNGSSNISTIYYAKLNIDGTVGSWQTSAVTTPVARNRAASVVANGYVYLLGGTTNQFGGNPSTANVYYAKLNQDGSIGEWVTATGALGAVRSTGSAVFANGYIYYIGGQDNSGAVNTVYYGKVTASGDIASFTQSSQTLPTTKYSSAAAVANGYVYYLSGYNGSILNTVFYAPLGSAGDTGAWRTSSFNLPRTFNAEATAVANGYIYSLGGEGSFGISSSVYYTSTSRVTMGGSLDLVGAGGQNLAEGGTAGSLTAGNTKVVGTLEIQDNVFMNRSAFVGGGLTVGGGAVFGTVNGSSQTITYVRSSGVAGTSFSLNVGTPGTNRLVVITASIEGKGTNLTGASVGGKACQLVAIAENTDSTGNHTEMWYCDEDDLGSTSGSVTVAITGGSASWATHALLYTGASHFGPTDYGINNSAVATATVSVTNIDVAAGGMALMTGGTGDGTTSVSSWTSPLTDKQDGPDPTGALLNEASGVESSVQTNKTYTLTWAVAANRSSAIVASWPAASTGGLTIDSANFQVRKSGTARNDMRVNLIPEYAGLVLNADGSSNTGTLTSDLCSGSSKKSINTSVCAASEEHNYYSWTTSQASDQDYDLYIRYQLPSDFNGFSSPDSIQMYGWRTDSTNNTVNLSLYQADGTQCGSTTNVATGTATWTETALTGDESACTFNAGDIIYFKVKVTASQNEFARAGEIRFNYLSNF